MMRPIALSISGLHSFREKQVVDFATLREVGVFGIFGPTGSGKSSILDAMTLALYGKVERATNNTQGIMNHAEDTLSVAFTFEIGKGPSKRRYRVERTYKRTAQLSVRTSVCRLTEIGHTDIVLADKERDVTANVQQILGLTIDDFTRAVVLPQGKFAEFLSLRGSERRKMLERLFHLEKYGERLNQRLKEKLASANVVVNEIVAAQSELGATSEEEVEAAKLKRNEAETQFELIEKQLSMLEKAYENKKQLWKWQLEKQEILAKKTDIEKQQDEMTVLSNRLEKAEEAEQLKPFFTEWKKWGQATSECEEEYEHVKHRLKEIADETALAKHNYEQKRKEREENFPLLIQQIERYKIAQQLEKDFDSAVSEKDKLQRDYEKIKQQLKNEYEKLNDLLEKTTNQKKQLTEIEEEMQRSTVDTSERKRVQQAVFEKRQLDEWMRTIRELENEHKAKQTTYEEKRAAYNEQFSRHERHRQGALPLFYKIESIYMQLANLLSIIQQHRKKTIRKKEDLQVLIEKETLNELAKELQAQLKEGEPCPVCRSTTHRHKINEHKQVKSLDSERQKFNRYEAIISNMNECEIKISHKLSNLKQLSKEMFNQLEDEQVSLQQIDDEVNEEQNMSIEDMTAFIHQNVKRLQQDVLLVDERVASYHQHLQKSTQQLSIIQTELLASKQSLDEINEKLTDTKATYEKHMHEWEVTYTDKAINNIETELINIQKQDERLAKVTQQYNIMKQVIDERMRKIDERREGINNLTVKVKITSFDLKKVHKELEHKRNQIKEIVGEESVERLLNISEQQLKALELGEKTALEQVEMCEKKLQLFQSRETSTRERLSQLTERKAEATKHWQEKLAKSSFVNETELEEALADEKERKTWSNVLTDFEEKWNAVQYDLERVNELIGENQISEKQWEETKNERTRVKQQHADAFKLKSEANYHYKQVEKQYKRFQELESEREKAQTLVTRLTKLESVFRGNAFVEFMAEEQLMQVTKDASVRLGRLTNQRYAIEVNSEGGFVIRDDANGGVRRPVSTLSGGETFLTSLALALSLSSHIQLRGKYPLEFFFLDEGFGTLDQQLLETVITSLEKLQMENVSIGIISHVPELKARLARKLIVHAAEPAGIGSRITMSS